MTYDLDVRKEGWPDWVAVSRDHSGSDFRWDPGSMPSGTYRFRVIASDAPSNRQGDKLSVSRFVSDPFTLDRDPPAVTIAAAKQVGKRIEVNTSAKDGQTRLTAAAYSLNGLDWWPLFRMTGCLILWKKSSRFNPTSGHPDRIYCSSDFATPLAIWEWPSTIVCHIE